MTVCYGVYCCDIDRCYCSNSYACTVYSTTLLTYSPLIHTFQSNITFLYTLICPLSSFRSLVYYLPLFSHPTLPVGLQRVPHSSSSTVTLMTSIFIICAMFCPLLLEQTLILVSFVSFSATVNYYCCDCCCSSFSSSSSMNCCSSALLSMTTTYSLVSILYAFCYCYLLIPTNPSNCCLLYCLHYC